MFRNRIRLPFYITRPQFPSDDNVFRLANGSTKVASTVIKKVFDGETENLPAHIHERLIIALKHDDVRIEGYRYLGGVALEGAYEIEWNRFLDFPLAKAEFKVQVSPFDYSNDNCQTCEELSQVVCEDDDIGTLVEDETLSIPVLNNDSICCKPVTISLITYNTDFLDSCIISGNDIIIHAKPVLPDANSVLLLTYRAQCPNGAYDEANVIGNINGSAPPTCLAPVNLQWVDSPSDTSAQFNWDAPSSVPDCGYYWEVRTSLGVLLASGDVTDTDVLVTGLPSNETNLRFFVRSNCCDDISSNFAGPVIFSLPPPVDTETCGEYSIDNFDFTAIHFVTYIDCNGVSQEAYVIPGGNRLICALQNSPGDPVSITPSHFDINITYVGLC